jgi:hypothetical protein
MEDGNLRPGGHLYRGGYIATACASGLEKTSATTLAAMAMWRMSNANSATKDSCLHWRVIHGSESKAARS